MSGLKYLDPKDAVFEVGKQNTELVEEMDRLHKEIDIYRHALTAIINMHPSEIASNPDAPRVVATLGLSHGTRSDPPEPQPRIVI